jgi:tetratricopeptide (TPR) repeat protein
MTDLAKAIEALEMMLARNPGNPAALQDLGGLRLSNGDIQGAIAAYSRCITFAPQNAAAHNNLGVALRKSGRLLEMLERRFQTRPHRVIGSSLPVSKAEAFEAIPIVVLEESGREVGRRVRVEIG